MRAVVIEGTSLVVAERPDPSVGDTELLVAVRAAGINRGDVMQRDGFYPPPPGYPADIPGMELAGEVVGLGRAVTRFSLGDAVMAVVGGGAQAERCVVEESHAMAVPQGLDWEQAGGFPEVFSTAHDALFTQCRLAMGERVLVTGAAGGVGTAAVQLGAACGAHVVASVRNHDHHQAVAALGAAEVIDPDATADHGPYDVVLELIGAASLPAAFGALGTGGRISVIGVGGGSKAELNLLLLMAKRASLFGSTLRPRSKEEKALVARAVESQVLPLVARGPLHVPVSHTYPLSEAATAYRDFEAGGKLGKLVLTNEE